MVNHPDSVNFVYYHWNSVILFNGYILAFNLLYKLLYFKLFNFHFFFLGKELMNFVYVNGVGGE